MAEGSDKIGLDVMQIINVTDAWGCEPELILVGKEAI